MTSANQEFPSDSLRATAKRLLLAWYLDFLFYSVFVTLLSHSADWTFGTTWVAQLVGFGLIRSAVSHFIETPGMMLLGIHRDGTRDSTAFQQESWLTMLLGTVFILDGAKRAVRWTEYARSLPDFGVLPDETGQIILSLVWGAGLITAGCLILRMRASGLWLGMALAVVALISIVWSWPLWDQALAQEVSERRLAQGLPVRPGEVEFMQRVIPLSLVVAHALAIGALLAVQRRFQAV